MRRGSLGLAREGYPFILIALVLSVLGFWLFWPLGVALAVFLGFTLNFFRDPERQPPDDASLFVSPADGTVLKVETLSGGRYLTQPHQKISIFMSALNVHVNRIPVDGSISRLEYFPGQFFVASLDKASEKNERNAVVLRLPTGDEVAFIQIAGLVARRIVCYLKEGLKVRRGERYGMIRFGSRMEVCAPVHWKPLVKKGDRVSAGASPLFEMKERI